MHWVFEYEPSTCSPFQSEYCILIFWIFFVCLCKIFCSTQKEIGEGITQIRGPAEGPRDERHKINSYSGLLSRCCQLSCDGDFQLLRCHLTTTEQLQQDGYMVGTVIKIYHKF